MIIKSGTFIPDSEKWLYQNDGEAKLNRALDWAEKNKPNHNVDHIAKRVEK